MALFANAQAITTTDADVIRSNKFTLDAGVYQAVIKMAYKDSSASSAAECVKLDLAVVVDGKVRNYSEAIWVVGRDGSVFKQDAKTGKMVPTYGFKQLDVLSKLTLGKGAEQLSAETLKVEIKKGEAPQDREVIRELIGAKLMVGILEKRGNKQVKSATGAWVNGPEERLENNIDKFFDEDGKTIVEKENNSAPVFIDTWKAEFSGKLIDQFKPVAGNAVGGVPANAGKVSGGSLI